MGNEMLSNFMFIFDSDPQEQKLLRRGRYDRFQICEAIDLLRRYFASNEIYFGLIHLSQVFI